MRFQQIDQITLLERGKRIEAVKTLTGHEDYLRDHFPRFPVMPGVLMLEALYQASTLLVRATEGFSCGLVLLREVKNVKFADFMQPGQALHIVAEIIKQDGNRTILKATGFKADAVAVSGRLVLESQPNANGQPDIVDRLAGNDMRQLTEQLQRAAMVGG